MAARLRIIKLVEGFIRSTKGDVHYTIDNRITLFDFFLILRTRFFQRIRGEFSRITGVKFGTNFYKGRRVKLLFKRHLNLGSNVIIEDGVVINALSNQGVQIGNNVTIQKSCNLICTGVIKNLGEGIVLHDGVGVNMSCFFGGQGGIEIFQNVIIGPGVKIFSENHNFESTEIPIKMQGEIREKVTIGEDCWIGAGCIIMAGVELGKGCIVAAGSVVTKSFPSFSLIGGVPARLIRTRV